MKKLIPLAVYSRHGDMYWIVAPRGGNCYAKETAAQAECDRLNAEEESQQAGAILLELDKRIRQAQEEADKQIAHSKIDGDARGKVFHQGMAEGLKLASIILRDVKKGLEAKPENKLPAAGPIDALRELLRQLTEVESFNATIMKQLSWIVTRDKDEHEDSDNFSFTMQHAKSLLAAIDAGKAALLEARPPEKPGSVVTNE